MTYLPRALDAVLDEFFPGPFAVAIDGARAVGKTATAARRVERAVHLDDPAVVAAVAAGPEVFLDGASTVLFDEWQELPEVWDRVRRRVDAHSTTSYLLTGSAAPKPGATTHSGAGRIVRLLLRPMSLRERQVTPGGVSIAELFAGGTTPSVRTAFDLAAYAREICASGLPGVRQASERLRAQLLDSYVVGILDRDIVLSGVHVRRPGTLRAWLAAYAAASSTTASYSAILDAATVGERDKPARDTTTAYRDALAKIWVLDPVPPWRPILTPLPRLKVGVKHQLMDPALAARLLGATPETLLSGAPGASELLGQLFESLATLCVRAEALAVDAAVSHLRTRNGDREVDLIVENSQGQVVAFEVKLAQAVNDGDVSHLHWLKKRLGDRVRDIVALTTGAHSYRTPGGVLVLPLALLG